MLLWTATLGSPNVFVMGYAIGMLTYPFTERLHLNVLWQHGNEAKGAMLSGFVVRLENAQVDSVVLRVYLDALRCFVFVKAPWRAMRIPWRKRLVSAWWRKRVSRYDAVTLPGTFDISLD
jgi:hypothetical protein